MNVSSVVLFYVSTDRGLILQCQSMVNVSTGMTKSNSPVSMDPNWWAFKVKAWRMLTSVYMENLNCEFECMMEWVCVLSLCVEVYEMSQERSAHAIITEKAKIVPYGTMHTVAAAGVVKRIRSSLVSTYNCLFRISFLHSFSRLWLCLCHITEAFFQRIWTILDVDKYSMWGCFF